MQPNSNQADAATVVSGSQAGADAMAPDSNAGAKTASFDSEPTVAVASSVTEPAVETPATDTANSAAPDQIALDEAFERGRIAGLQEAILASMSKNGSITDQMRRDVADNVYHDSLINWIKSFR